MKYILLLSLPFLILNCTPSQKEEAPQKEKLEKVLALENISLTVKTKFDSEIDIICHVFYFGEHDFKNTKDPINQQINQAIIDSLHQFDMHQIWATKRLTIDQIVEGIFKENYPTIYKVYVPDVIIPEYAEKSFKKTDKDRHDLIDALDEIFEQRKLLQDSLKTNNIFSAVQITKIEKEISIFEDHFTSLQKKGKLIEYDKL
ncbi:MAG: hypothetical protein ACJAUD_001275 [Crocinitomicaceae bacterium]|jgi:hypothetical protein